MALLRGGPERMGQLVTIPVPGQEALQARVVETCFYDKEGAKQDV